MIVPATIRRGLGQTLAPITTNPANTPPAGSAVAPSGYWVNPANPTQWLSQTDAAKIGSFCLSGLAFGKYDVAGNYEDSQLFCKTTTTDILLSMGVLAAASYALLPGPVNVLAALGIAAYGVLAAGVSGL